MGRLNDEDRARVRSEFKPGMAGELAGKYGVSPGTIFRAVRQQPSIATYAAAEGSKKLEGNNPYMEYGVTGLVRFGGSVM